MAKEAGRPELNVTGALVLQLLSAAGGLAGIGVLVKAIFDRPKTRAEAVQIATDTASKVTTQTIEQLRSELARVITRAEAAEGKADKLSERVDQLEGQVDAEQEANRSLRAENRSQMAYIRSVADWAHVHYSGPNPPPAYLPFDQET
jgi:predicted kinase